MPMRRHGELPARNVPRAARASALRGAGTLLGTLNTSLLNIQSLNELTPRRILTHRHMQCKLSGKSHTRSTRTRITMTYEAPYSILVFDRERGGAGRRAGGGVSAARGRNVK